MIPYTVLLFVSVLISAYSQILLKKAANRTYSRPIFEYLNPYVLSGYTIFFVAVLLDMTALRKVPVSYIPVIESSSYAFVILFSRLFLKERLNAKKLLAICIILCGIAVYLI
ncbi:MAG: EamA family transporter [Treponema sp.]|nr:EamA family transporter [Treponema sp.]